jgi:4-alpha-glucanotransferase
VLSSVANTAIIPLQDVLGAGIEGRMNLPNSTEGTGVEISGRLVDGYDT